MTTKCRACLRPIFNMDMVTPVYRWIETEKLGTLAPMLEGWQHWVCKTESKL